MENGIFFWPLVALSVAAAIAYGVTFERRKPSLVRAGVKTLFMAALAGAFFGAPGPVFIALVAAAVGDFFLAFDDKPWALPLGMIAFLVMQLLYCASFFGLWMLSGDGAPLWPRTALTIATLALLGGYLIWFWSDAQRKGTAALAVLGALTLGAAPLVIIATSYLSAGESVVDPRMPWPIPIAIFLICAALMWFRRDLGLVRLGGMAYAAIIAQMVLLSFWLPWIAWPAMLGALLFLVSDGVLSAELFRMKPDAPARRITGQVVWWTYAAAQLLIVWGMMRAAAQMV